MAGTPDQAQLLAAGIRAAQSTPLLSRRGELVGMITTHWKECHEPSECDLRMFDILARLAADLIERTRHDEEARRREERLRILTQLLTDVPWQARSDGAFGDLQLALGELHRAVVGSIRRARLVRRHPPRRSRDGASHLVGGLLRCQRL
jgi:GAF domain-containing protein